MRLLGVAQSLAIFPSVSRSGSTITGGVLMGIEKESAAKFSFLLSIPAIVGGTVFLLRDAFREPPTITIGIAPLLIGFITSMVFGYLSIKVLLKLISKNKLKYFSVYLFILGGLILFDSLVSNIFM